MSNFLYFVIGFFFGATVVDFIWAWKFGIPQIFWYRIGRVFSKIFR
jgi:hypothetical protein